MGIIFRKKLVLFGASNERKTGNTKCAIISDAPDTTTFLHHMNNRIYLYLEISSLYHQRLLTEKIRIHGLHVPQLL